MCLHMVEKASYISEEQAVALGKVIAFINGMCKGDSADSTHFPVKIGAFSVYSLRFKKFIWLYHSSHKHSW